VSQRYGAVTIGTHTVTWKPAGSSIDRSTKRVGASGTNDSVAPPPGPKPALVEQISHGSVAAPDADANVSACEVTITLIDIPVGTLTTNVGPVTDSSPGPTHVASPVGGSENVVHPGPVTRWTSPPHASTGRPASGADIAASTAASGALSWGSWER